MKFYTVEYNAQYAECAVRDGIFLTYTNQEVRMVLGDQHLCRPGQQRHAIVSLCQKNPAKFSAVHTPEGRMEYKVTEGRVWILGRGKPFYILEGAQEGDDQKILVRVRTRNRKGAHTRHHASLDIHAQRPCILAAGYGGSLDGPASGSWLDALVEMVPLDVMRVTCEGGDMFALWCDEKRVPRVENWNQYLLRNMRIAA